MSNMLKGTILNPEVIRGKSAYEIAVMEGFVGTQAEWLESLKGKSAYEIAVMNGFKGTQAEWLESLKGNGKDGKTAYSYAKEGGYEGTEADFATDLAKAISGGNITVYNGEGEVV